MQSSSNNENVALKLTGLKKNENQNHMLPEHHI